MCSSDLANFGNMPIAGKTGTTTSNRDVLFAGFTPYYTCTVWCGYDDNSPQEGGLTSNPKTLWNRIMGRVHENLEYRDFTQPDGILTAAVCKKSGKLAVSGLCDSDPRGSMVETEYFAVGTVPTEYCDHHVSATICTASGLLANEFCPAEARQGGIYMVGGSGDSDDGQYMLPAALAQDNYCTVHTAATIIPEIPEIPQVDMPGDTADHPEDANGTDDTEEQDDKEDKKKQDNNRENEGGED